MKIIKTEHELTQEESAVLLCELAHENTTINMPTIKVSAVDEMLRQAEIYRKQKNWGGNL